MSGTGNEGNQNPIGVLFKRMTLSNLGLDAMEDVDSGSMDALAGAEALAARVSEGAGRIGGADQGLGVLPGMPRFLRDVQERYLPTYVDTDFGRVFQTDGPSSPTDLGPWRNWLDAIFLMLFEEDEEGLEMGAPTWRPDVSRQTVRQAATRQLTGRPDDVKSMLSAMPEAVRKIAEKRIAKAQAKRRKPSSFLSITESERSSLFGRVSPGDLTVAQPEMGFAGLDAGFMADEVDSGVSEEARAGVLAQPSRRRRAQVGMPGMASMRGASFAERIAQRASAAAGASRRPAGGRERSTSSEMMVSMRGMRPLSSPGAEALESSSWTAPWMGEGEGSSLYATPSYRGSLPGSLLAMVPEGQQQEVLSEVFYGRDAGASRGGDRAASSGALVPNYPASMGRAGALQRALLEPRSATPMGGPAGSGAEAPSSARVQSFMRAPSASARALQWLSDEPTARLMSALDVARGDAPQTAGAARERRASARMLESKPFMPSTLGFAREDARASMRSELGTLSALGELPGLMDRFEQVQNRSAQMSFGDVPGALVQPTMEPGDLDAAVARELATFAVRERAMSGSGRPMTAMDRSMSAAISERFAGDVSRERGPQVQAQRGSDELPPEVARLVEARMAPEQLVARLMALPESTLAALPAPVRRALAEHRARLAEASEETGDRGADVPAIERALRRLAASRGVEIPTIERALRRMSGARAPRAMDSLTERLMGAGDEPALGSGDRVVLGDMVLQQRYMPGLVSGLTQLSAVDQRFSEPQRMPQGALTGGANEEQMMGRLGRMLSLVQVGDAESGELRSELAAMRRGGQASPQSRVAWMGETPVLVSIPGESAEADGIQVAQRGDLWRMLESGLTASQAKALTRGGTPVMSLSQVVPGLSQKQLLGAMSSVEPQRLESMLRARSGGQRPGMMDTVRSGELSRMMSFGKASSVLLPQLVASGGDVGVMRDLERSLLGSVEAPGGEASPLVERLMRGGEVRSTGRGLGTDRVSLALRGASPEARRAALSLREPMGFGGMTGPMLDASLDVPRAASGAGRVGQSSAAFMPGVMRAPNFAMAVERELLSGMLEAREAGSLSAEALALPRLARAASEPSGSSLSSWSSEGELVRMSLSPAALSQATGALAGAAGGARAQSVQRVISEAVERPGASAETIAAELQTRLPGLRLRMPTVSGGSERASDPARGASAAAQMISRAVRAMSASPQPFETLSAPGVAGTAAQRQAESLASREGYFASLVPTEFSGEAPSRLLASAYASLSGDSAGGLGGYGVPERGFGRESVGSQVSLPGRMAAGEARGGGVSADWGGMLELEAAHRASSSKQGVFHPVRAEALSPMLSRIASAERGVDRARSLMSTASVSGGAGELVSMPASAASGAGGLERSAASQGLGQPGTLSAVLERFVPAGVSASRRSMASSRGLEGAALTSRGGRLLPTGGGGDLGALVSSSGDAAVSRMMQPALTEALRDRVEGVLSTEASSGDVMRYLSQEGSGSVSELYEMGSGMEMVRQVDGIEDRRVLDRIERLLDRAESMSERPRNVSSARSDMAVVKHTPQVREDPYQGLPSWRRKDDHVQGVQVDELRDMLRKVGAMPIQGSEIAAMRDFVNPYVGQSQKESEHAPDPLFSGGGVDGGAGASSGGTTSQNSGLPSTEDLDVLVNELYQEVLKLLAEAVAVHGFD